MPEHTVCQILCDLLDVFKSKEVARRRFWFFYNGLWLNLWFLIHFLLLLFLALFRSTWRPLSAWRPFATARAAGGLALP